ncbi:MAG: periplasmic heavy metal sensor [Flavobacterium sp.]|jgi:Spy/CpxP family protein refolding chaperone|nr:periplasmic heavy metal sensor [Flavobacterium sp.]
MTKTNVLYGIVALLVALNITILLVVLGKAQPPQDFGHRPPNLRSLIEQELQFDAQQKEKLSELIDSHRAEISELDAQIQKIRGTFYESLADNQSTLAQQNKLLQQLGQLQIRIEKGRWQHFMAIKKLCRPEQLDDFSALTKELVRALPGGPRPPHRPRHD